ncbi:unnamed protein product [Ostreobium quekettii]|uniref:Uncharacterized protein n=1 Tax=Ostreobium quekettii TaxID=121088 RepID=A0A8S1IY60_9CHLO|nr:unnamed protein product [Ostreobium quekettii]
MACLYPRTAALAQPTVAVRCVRTSTRRLLAVCPLLSVLLPICLAVSSTRVPLALHLPVESPCHRSCPMPHASHTAHQNPRTISRSVDKSPQTNPAHARSPLLPHVLPPTHKLIITSRGRQEAASTLSLKGIQIIHASRRREDAL